MPVLTNLELIFDLMKRNAYFAKKCYQASIPVFIRFLEAQLPAYRILFSTLDDIE